MSVHAFRTQQGVLNAHLSELTSRHVMASAWSLMSVPSETFCPTPFKHG